MEFWTFLRKRKAQRTGTKKSAKNKNSLQGLLFPASRYIQEIAAKIALF